MSKKVWEYRGKNSQGFNLEGTINEASRHEAEATARRMGIINPVIIDPIDPERQPIGDPILAEKHERIIPVVPVPVPPGLKPISAAEKRLGEMVHGMQESVERHIADNHPLKIRQTLVIGDESRIGLKVDPLLDGGGRVLSVNMHPNHNGIMIFAVVVEHNEKEKK